jgi:hypothetical protein
MSLVTRHGAQADNAWRVSLRGVTVADLADRTPAALRARNTRLLA